MGKAKLIKVLKGVEDVAGAIPRVTASSRGASGLPGLDLLTEYNKTAKTPRVGTIEDEIVDLTASQRETARLDAVQNPDSDFIPEAQTVSADEYAVRVKNQLRDPEYQVKGLLGTMDEHVLKQRKIDNLIDHHMQARTLDRMRRNPRTSDRLDVFWGDSAFKDQMFYHLDVQTDPMNPMRMIQYDHPREMGVHAGTNRAAESVPGMMSPEEFAIVHKELTDTIDEMATKMNVDTAEVETIIANTVENFWTNRFGKAHGQPPIPPDEIWGDWEEMVEEITTVLGTEYGDEAVKTMSDLRRLPRPSTTPTVFRGKNGLLMRDDGGWQVERVYLQLRDLFNEADDWKRLETAMGAAGEEAKQKALQQFIESKGYDHIVYFNTVEDRGSMSVINWNEDLMKSILDPEFHRGGPKNQAGAVSSVVMGILGIGGAGATLQSDE